MIVRALSSLLILPAVLTVAAPDREVLEPPASTSVEAAVPGTYVIDPVHSELSFRIRHLVGRVAGTFTDWGGTLRLDPSDLSGGSVEVRIQTASINTLNEQRDDHLRSADFFAAEAYPTMTYRSNRVEVDGDRIKVYGDLTLRGVTRPVVLEGEYLGRVEKDPWGQERVAFLARTTIDRQEFGVWYNQMLETMSVIGDEVSIEIAIEAVRQ